ncbi:TetR/AcrR family transcriptional regulator [Alkalihalobacillus sp. BA299]|uniref:TetR/AcrR family transcriptional regulator n=1 Tax=Alkalihalobacillus sp. BA299 TaxID=2815938 RepID=UPI001ADD0BD5|nr:TetR/AcrR family transcriptional regulator [Alkalihalobacillus sp. BA299]
MSIVSLEESGDLVNKKREIIVEAAIGLIIEKGYDRTTTREIAKESNMSFGTIFKYFGCKENILISVMESIYADLLCKIKEIERIETKGYKRLKKIIECLVTIYDEMKDEVLIICQESKSVPKDSQSILIKNEELLNKTIEMLIMPCLKDEGIALNKKNNYLLSQNIRMLGQLWVLQYRFLKSVFSIETYIKSQSNLIISSLNKGQ